MNHLIIGAGEVGKALREILQCQIRDVTPGMDDPKDVWMLHICFPYSESFIRDVRMYQDRYEPRFTVIHSTVPVGTTRILKACHSPIRGRHPELVEGIRTFVKFFAGEGAYAAAETFQELGIETELVLEPETTEAGKLWDLLQYALSIVVQKEMYRWCEEHGADPEVAYKRFNDTYNQGYETLGLTRVRRPVLKDMPGPIGGHCVVPGTKMIEHPFVEIVEEYGCRSVPSLSTT